MANTPTPATVTLIWGTNYKQESPRDIVIPKGVFNTEKEARAAMVADWKSHGQKVYYTRSWKLEDGCVEVVDYGNHIYFYFLVSDYPPLKG